MAISDEEKVDLLWKKFIYGVSKTETPGNKSPSNETIPSPIVALGNEIWINARDIPTIPPTATTSDIEVKTKDGDGAVQLVMITDSSTAKAWRAFDTDGTTPLDNWIPFSLGSGYALKLWSGDPSVATPSATMLFIDGSGNNDEYFFDQKAGVLYFIGANIPAGWSGGLYIEGYRYVGPSDIADLAGGGGGGGGGSSCGNAIALCAPTNGNLTDGLLNGVILGVDFTQPPAVALTEATTVTDAIDLINETMGLLLPANPPVFPGSQALTFSSIGNVPYLSQGVTDYSDEPPTSANKVVAGDPVVRVITGTNVLSNTITSCGPGNTGTLTATLNKTTATEAAIGTPVTFDDQDNATDPNDNSIQLIVVNNVWYPVQTPGFWQAFDTSLSINYNNLSPGIHKATIEHTSGTELHGFFVFDDFISNPDIDASEMTISSVTPNTVYSSGVPHFGQGAKVILDGIKLSNMVGKTYYGGDFLTVSISNTFGYGSNANPILASIDYSHTDFGKPPELSETDWQTPEELGNGVDIPLSNTDSIKTFRLQMTVTNVNATESIQLSPIFLYANGNPVDAITEDGIPVVGYIGATNGDRVKFSGTVAGASEQPVALYSSADSDFSWSSASTFQNLLYASVVGGQISHDITNYQPYYPAGPNYSSSDRQTNSQYITFRFTGTGISNFDIDIKGQLKKCFIKLEGITDQYSSTKWWSMNIPAEAGIPGDVAGLPNVSGTLGCASSNTVMPPASSVDGRFNCTFGLANSTNATDNGILIRFVLDPGDYIERLRFVNPSSA